MTQLLQHSEADFNRVPLDNLRSIADELERETCGQLLRFIFQESEEIERYPRAYRERFDIAFSQAVFRFYSIKFPYGSVQLFLLLVNMSGVFNLRSFIIWRNQ